MSTKTPKTWMFLGLLAATVCTGALAAAAPAPPAAGKTADQVLEEYLTARGGKAKLQAIKTLRQTGKLSGGQLDGSTVIVRKKRPDKARRDFSGAAGTMVHAFDGQVAWQLGGPQGGPKATPAPPPALRRLRRASEFEGPVPDKSATSRIDLVGKEKVGNRDAYLVKVKFKDGSEVSYDFDTATHLLIRTAEVLPTPRGPQMVETSYRDYKPAGGVLWPFTEVITAKEGKSQTLAWSKVEANPAIDDSIFKMPS